MLVVDYISEYLKAQGVDTVFGYQGGNISFLIDAISRHNMSFVENYNEQGSSFAANSYAEISGKFGVAVSSSGPGAINMLNGIANAYYDGIPCLYITGDVNTAARQKYKGVRQSEFQEVDIVAMSKPIAKIVYQVTNADDIPLIMDEAIRIMQEPRKGPVIINLAHNIQKTDIETKQSDKITPNYNSPVSVHEESISEKLSEAETPVVLIGGGAREAKEGIVEFLDRSNLPFACTLRALDFHLGSKNYLGFAGNYGSSKAKEYLNKSDLILVLGARLDVRVASAIVGLENKTIIQIDCDEAELNKLTSKEYIRIQSGLEQIDFSRIKYTCVYKQDVDIIEDNTFAKLDFKSFFSRFSTILSTTYTLDVGLHQMAAARYLNLKNNDRVLSSGGLGSMGYALPASIGAYYADRGKLQICFSGDGGIQMNIQELETISRERLPIHIFILHNGCLGMIRNYQDFALGGRHTATIEGFSSPDYQKIAEAYGMKYSIIKDLSHIQSAVDAIINSNEPSITMVSIPVDDNID